MEFSYKRSEIKRFKQLHLSVKSKSIRRLLVKTIYALCLWLGIYFNCFKFVDHHNLSVKVN